MPELTSPTTRVHASFLAAMAEFVAEGRTGDDSMIGRNLVDYGPTWADPTAFADYVDALVRDDPRPLGVASTNLWWVDGDEYLGRLSVRHELSAHLLEVGGHIGYDVRASVRRRGHAGAMLGAALPVAGALGIEKALITCDTTNVASRKVIESVGGVLEDERHGRLRYWVSTA